MRTETKMRELERQAATGDESAQEQLDHMRSRAGKGRHGDKVGKWVLLCTVRDHYRGKLLGITELGGGGAILHLAPCYWLESLASTSNEVDTGATEEHPMDHYAHGILSVLLQRSERRTE